MCTQLLTCGWRANLDEAKRLVAASRGACWGLSAKETADVRRCCGMGVTKPGATGMSCCSPAVARRVRSRGVRRWSSQRVAKTALMPS
jgi:hypothetical protein